MDKNYIFDLIDRLRQSACPPNLREEVIRVITQQRYFLEDVHISAKQNGDKSAEHISGIALGKSGYNVGDAAL